MLLFYDTTAGAQFTANVTPDGTFIVVSGDCGPVQGWTHLTALGDGVVLLYNAATGDWGTGYVAPDSTMSPVVFGQGQLNPGWTQIAFVGDRELLFYNTDNGDYYTGFLAFNGTFTDLVSGPGGFRQGWTTIVAP